MIQPLKQLRLAAIISAILMIGGLARSLQPAEVPEFAVPALGATNRVTAAAMIYPTSASRGDIVTLFVKVRVAPGHHIYALEKPGTRNLPTSFETELPVSTLRPEGPWRGPEPKVNEDGSRTFSGDLLFQRRFRVEPQAATGACEAVLKLNFQVCNEALCWPPATIPLKFQLKVERSR